MTSTLVKHLPLRSISVVAAVMVVLASPAHAVVNGTDTSSYSAVGAIQGASGVQITGNWVLTAAHVVAGLTPNVATFASVAGSSTVDAVYTYSSEVFPNNDIALVHLSTAIASALPVLNDQVISNAQAAKLGSVTIVSAQNQTPNGYGVSTLKSAMTTNYDNGTTDTVNWVIARGGASVQSGDSGGALFKGTPTDSGGSVLLGVASAALTYSTGEPVSAFIQTAAYKSWIDATMASSGQQAVWSSTALPYSSKVALPDVLTTGLVPEPSTTAMFALCGLAALVSQPVRRRLMA